MVINGIRRDSMVFNGIRRDLMVFNGIHRLHSVVQLIWRAGELPRSASSHFH